MTWACSCWCTWASWLCCSAAIACSLPRAWVRLDGGYGRVDYNPRGDDVERHDVTPERLLLLVNFGRRRASTATYPLTLEVIRKNRIHLQTPERRSVLDMGRWCGC